MLFLRMGPRLLFIRTEALEAVKKFFLEEMQGKETAFMKGMEDATEESSLIFLTDTTPVKTDIGDAKAIIIVNQPASVCLATIINSQIAALVKKVDMGPSSIIMRTVGNKSSVVKQIANRFDGRDLSLEAAVNQGEQGDTILFLTTKQLSRRLLSSDLLDTPLLLPYPAQKVFRSLGSEGILYITQSLEERKWYELRINIYDTKEKYQEHYDRLNYVLSQLEVGMVLEEGWTRDHALAMFSVLAYQIRLFTFYKPEEIKRILLGLEYDHEGNRLADFDLYYRNKKVSWVDIDKKREKRNKVKEGIKYRRELVDNLSPEDREKLMELEQELYSES
ncbi:hypothetical protein RH915_08995 [Serpentinicella sp. ANB-PHB4]|uniref:hypothetical protein n=1 Tax=Serpentinicella sp. ANB-PHB4 TaxID=3074076 RepID=UPI00285FD6BE|nr:hypothetical protein [Serpentinicella sp. ANB-PHB4]MDR5659630.1 hypothetical protein [Serpentinicella sp. ANB-PHB4]